MEIQPPDQIRIENLWVLARVGVPEEERAEAQRLALDVILFPARPLTGLGDDVSRTIDYFEVSERLKAVAGEGERRLIESLAEDLLEVILREFPVSAATVEVKKFILEEADAVAVRLTRNS